MFERPHHQRIAHVLAALDGGVCDLAKAIERLQARQGWLERCMQAMAMTLPQAVVWQGIRALRRLLNPA